MTSELKATRSPRTGNLDSWKGMLVSLIAFLVAPAYQQLTVYPESYASSWGLSWFGFGWDSVFRWRFWMEFAFDNFEFYLSYGVTTIIPVALALLVFTGLRERSSAIARSALVLAGILLVDHIYMVYSFYARFAGIFTEPGSGFYLDLPFDTVILVIFIFFAFKSQSVPAKAVPSTGVLGRPRGALALSLLGGVLLFPAGFFLGGAGIWQIGAYEQIIGTALIIGALSIYIKPSSARSWGVPIVILSIVAGLNLFALAGGIMAMRWKRKAAVAEGTPIASAAPATTLASPAYCVSCGTRISDSAPFCPQCGAKQP